MRETGRRERSKDVMTWDWETGKQLDPESQSLRHSARFWGDRHPAVMGTDPHTLTKVWGVVGEIQATRIPILSMHPSEAC